MIKGEHEVVISRDANQMTKHSGSFDFILDCVSAPHDINAYVRLLGVDGNLTLFARRSVSASMMGGLPETQEMLDFCGQHNITANVEVIPMQKANEADERLLKSDVKYRFSIDMASL